jgi:formyl-CoA transferase
MQESLKSETAGPGKQRLIAVIEQVFADWDATDLLERLTDLGIPCGRVRSIDEVYEWEQTRSQGLQLTVDHSTLGQLSLPGPPLRFFASDGGERTRTSHAAPPVLDEHGSQIRSWIDAEQVRR